MNDPDKNFLTAAAINLYLESLRRGAGRVLLTPMDISTLYELIHVITNPIQATPVQDTARSRELNEEERQHVLNAVGQELPEGVTAVGLDDPAKLHNAIAEAVGEVPIGRRRH